MGWRRVRRLLLWLRLLFREVASTIVPKRASTQTWMFLTFAFFVGGAVLVVGLYARFVLHNQTETAARRQLREQALQIATTLGKARSYEEAWQATEQTSRVLGMRIEAYADDTLYVDARGETFIPQFYLPEDLEQDLLVPEGRMRFIEHTTTNGDPILICAVNHALTGFVIRLYVPEPPLYSQARNMQTALIVGMVMAFILAMFGSWVTARRVIKPLRAINERARKISDEKSNQKIFVRSRAAEFQDLATSLNRMSGQFRKKIENLERLSNLQSEFIGNVSHEVRNPIFAISGYLEALATPVLKPEQQKRYAEKALVNLERLSNLFNDLIEIARLEYREDMIRLDDFDLSELSLELEELLQQKAAKKDLQLEIEHVKIKAHADRDRIRQVLVNLIENAIVYTDEGGVKFKYRRRQDKVRIEVSDTGRGIPEENLERIFERFYRVDPDRSRKSGGTGLGLSIVKQILHAHGEQIQVESTLGRGTRFWFDLPLAEDEIQEETD
ncbi:MAG: sensor histidine kinase [Rhodothermales bacterium]